MFERMRSSPQKTNAGRVSIMGNRNGAERQQRPPVMESSSPPPPRQTLDQAWSEIDGPPTRQVTALLIGGGLRGQNLAEFALDFPARLKIVGVAEPSKNRREKIKSQYGISDDLAVDDWKTLAGMDKVADATIIATPDRLHKDPVIAFADKGYALLIEKPMSVSESECEEMAEACKRNETLASVCFELRYLPVARKVRELISEGAIGEVVTINHTENINHWHFAHSYVRGNWRKEAESTFSLLAKSSHDIDLILFWMEAAAGAECTRVQSFGNLYHFKEAQKPKGAASRCFDCPVEEKCAYSIQKVYLRGSSGFPHWPNSAVCDIEDHPKGYNFALREALEEGPYGRCVYNCDNDVVDHQMVNMEFSSGATVNFTMNAFTSDMCRETRICGTMGELHWNGRNYRGLRLRVFATGEDDYVPLGEKSAAPPCRTSAHGGADFFMVSQFVKAVANSDRSLVLSDAESALRSHRMVFAAERARREGAILDVVS